MRKVRRPVVVLIVALLQLVVGSSLLACGVFNLVSTVAGSSAATVTITVAGQSTTRTYDTREEMEKHAPGYKSFMLAEAVVALLLQFAMIAGGIGLLLMRGWSWWLSVAWAGLRLVVQCLTLLYLWFTAIPAANQMVKEVPRDDKGVCSSLVNGNTLYHVFWALFAVVFLLYPLLILVLLMLPPVRRSFNPPEAEEDERRQRPRYREAEDRRRPDRDEY
jgi:hypothetical protein